MLDFLKVDSDGSEEKRKKGLHIYYQIFNKDKYGFVYLGMIKKLRVGKFMHWCFCPDLDDGIDLDNFAPGDLYFTNGCLKEISAFITKLYNEERKQKKMELMENGKTKQTNIR